MESYTTERFKKTIKNLDKAIYIEGGFVVPNARGNLIGAKALYEVAKWLFEKHGKEVLYGNVTGIHILNSLLKVGVEI